jgi:hypothetical protein
LQLRCLLLRSCCCRDSSHEFLDRHARPHALCCAGWALSAVRKCPQISRICGSWSAPIPGGAAVVIFDPVRPVLSK